MGKLKAEMNTRRANKSDKFLAAAVARRALPGHCAHCGGPHPDKGPGQLKCPKCKRLLSAWARQRRGTPKPAKAQAPGADGSVMTLAVMLELSETRAELELLRKRVTAVVLKEYEHGRDRGRREERKRMARLAKQAQQRPEVAPWDAWDEQVGIDEQKQQCHRLAMACEG